MQYGWVVGVLLSLIASFLSTMGILTQKKAHDVVGTCARTLVWSLGFSGMVIGAVLDLAAFGFAAQSLLAPLGGSTIVFNALLSPCMTQEKLMRTDIMATFVILLGCTITVAFGDQSEQTFTVDELISYYIRVDVVLYFVVILIFVVSVFFTLRRLEAPYRDALKEDALLLDLAKRSTGEGAMTYANTVAGLAPLESPTSPSNELRNRAFSLNILTDNNVRSRSQTFPPHWVTAEARDVEAEDDAAPMFAPAFFGASNAMLLQEVMAGARIPRSGKKANISVIHSPKSGKRKTIAVPSPVPAQLNSPAFQAGETAGHPLRSSTSSSSSKGGQGRAHAASVLGLQSPQLHPRANSIMSPLGLGSPKVTMNWGAGRDGSVSSNQVAVELQANVPSEVGVAIAAESREEGESEGDSEERRRIEEFLSGRTLQVHAFLYASVAGTIGAQSVLFGKTLAELMKSPSDAFTSVSLYVVLLCMVFTLVMQLRFLNMGLVHHQALLIVPIYQTFWVMVSIVAGGIYFKEFQSFTLISGCLFCVGVVVALSGIFVLTYGRKNAGDEAEHGTSTTPGHDPNVDEEAEDFPLSPKRQNGRKITRARVNEDTKTRVDDVNIDNENATVYPGNHVGQDQQTMIMEDDPCALSPSNSKQAC